MRKYLEVKIVPTATFNAVGAAAVDPGASGYVTRLHCGGEELINELLTKGWEIIKFLTHHSSNHDVTAVIAVMGNPKGSSS